MPRRSCNGGVVLALEPAHPDWYYGLASNLIKLGRLDEAEAILVRALEEFPDERDLLGTRAMLETKRENWNGALALWRRYRALYPSAQAGWDGEGAAVAAIRFAHCDPAGDTVEPTKVDIETIEDDARRGPAARLRELRYRLRVRSRPAPLRRGAPRPAPIQRRQASRPAERPGRTVRGHGRSRQHDPHRHQER